MRHLLAEVLDNVADQIVADRRTVGMKTLFAAFACLLVESAAATDRWALEVYGGDAYNFRNRLEIRQDGGYSQAVSADWETRGMRSPPYYVLGGGRWQGEQGWEASLVHHKLYLRNPPAGVSGLSVSHGFNILTVNRAYRSGMISWRFGAGPVITHAEGTVNGTKYDGPYRLAGAALLAGAGRRHYLAQSFYFSLEGMLSAAYADAKMSGPPDARIRVRNVALHGLIGFGYEL
jgi:hypothetical protein